MGLSPRQFQTIMEEAEEQHGIAFPEQKSPVDWAPSLDADLHFIYATCMILLPLFIESGGRLEVLAKPVQSHLKLWSLNPNMRMFEACPTLFSFLSNAKLCFNIRKSKCQAQVQNKRLTQLQ